MKHEINLKRGIFMKIKSTLSKFLIIITVLSVIFSAFPTVFATEKPEFKNCEIKKGFSKKITLDNPENQKYTIKIGNTKIAKLKGKTTTKDGSTQCKIKGLKKGKTTAKIYVKGKKIGSFKIRVYSAKASVKKTCKTITLKYNNHGSSAYMTDCNIYAKELVKNIHPNGKYTALSDDYSIVNHTNDGLIYTVNKGTTTLKIIETVNGKKRSLGKITVKVKNTKMAYVARENAKFYPEGIFGWGNKYECVYLGNDGKKTDTQSRIKSCLINNRYTGSSFKASEYKIKYVSLDESIAKVNSKGVITGKAIGYTDIKYIITFSDKSNYTGFCHVSVQENVES